MTERTARIEIPDRYRYAVIPHIMVDDAAAAIDFYRRAFGAREDFRIDAPSGGILHAEITVGRSALMLGDAGAEASASSFAAPASLGGGTSVMLHVFVPDVDSLAERAEAAGAEILQPPTDMFHGDRTVIVKDPAGHMWVFLSHKEDVSQEELMRRLSAAE
ncbi:VOC family protein [Streptomyces sp. ID05-04B]|uniref:VOC family protein n=1 Tax=unclassified Streptomyces TaxID=2593676 RepID=UPI000D1B1726|nr:MULTISPECIES: VOC family protein [unclassified Streptomyces]AVV47141.1 glyoxalase [Streptomyces sp. P3]MDX5565025.1 VOC family protein [Streptomyces sp. ID05-04B]